MIINNYISGEKLGGYLTSGESNHSESGKNDKFWFKENNQHIK